MRAADVDGRACGGVSVVRVVVGEVRQVVVVADQLQPKPLPRCERDARRPDLHLQQRRFPRAEAAAGCRWACHGRCRSERAGSSSRCEARSHPIAIGIGPPFAGRSRGSVRRRLISSCTTGMAAPGRSGSGHSAGRCARSGGLALKKSSPPCRGPPSPCRAVCALHSAAGGWVPPWVLSRWMNVVAAEDARTWMVALPAAEAAGCPSQSRDRRRRGS